jgi:hypothetical protein
MNTKKCVVCGEEKGSARFYKRPDGSIENTCRPCRTRAEFKTQNNSPRDYLRNTLAKAKYGAKKRGLSFEIDIDKVMQIWGEQGGRCALSGVLMQAAKDGKGRKGKDLNVSLDRIDQDKGYIFSPRNVQLVCLRVNLMKHDMEESDLYWWCQNILEKSLR